MSPFSPFVRHSDYFCDSILPLNPFLQTNVADAALRMLEALPQFGSQYALVAGILLLTLLAIVSKPRFHYLPSVIFVSFILLSGALLHHQNFVLPLYSTYLYSIFFQILVLISGVLTCFLVENSSLSKSDKKTELYILLLFSMLGMSFLSISDNLLSIFLGLECVTLPSFCLAAFGFSPKSTESATKYVLYGSATAAIMLFGMSLLYGITGTTDLALLSHRLPQWITSDLAKVALVFVLIGLFFKIAVFPFHFWAPDVYEGTPTPIVAFFSIAPKALAFCVLIRIVSLLDSDFTQMILVVVSIVSMTFGNLLALGQTNAKRLLAYSSVSHSGFLLMGVASGRGFGFDSVIYYLSIYVLMNFSAFHLLKIMTRWKGSEEIESFSGLGKSNPYLATSLLITMISLTGLPPAAGFSAKLFMFSGVYEAYKAAHDPSIFAMLVAGLVNTVLSLFYYLKMPFYAFFRGNGENAPLVTSNAEKVFILTLNGLLLLFFFKPDWVFVLVNLIKLEGY
jgi:NADH-quinone oxidoreductase subunit N